MKRLFATLCFLLVLAGCSCGPTYEVSGDGPGDAEDTENAGDAGSPGRYGTFFGTDLSLDGNPVGMFDSEWTMTENAAGNGVLSHSDYPYLGFSVDLDESGTSFGSYHVDASAGDDAPDMSWRGVGFGGTESDLTDAYGEPDYRDECYGYVVLGYDFGNSEIDFAVYDDGRGLRLVNFCVF